MTLPPELIEKIIDDLAQQTPRTEELLAYSIVARTWRPRALSYVFRSISVSCLPWRRMSETLGLTLDPDAFLRMQDSAPHLLWYLRHLVIRLDGNALQYEAITRFARTLALPAPCALETLKFQDYTSVQGGVGLFENFAVRFPTLRRIEIYMLCMLPLEEIAQATAVAQELALVIPGAYSESTAIAGDSGVNLKTTITNLRRLDLDNSDYRVNAQFYAEIDRLCASAPNLQRVAVTKLSKSSFDRFMLVSSAFKDLIQELQFDVEQLTQFHLDRVLQHHPNLRILRLDAHGPNRQLPFPSASRTLERLHFTIHNVDAGAWTPRLFVNACGWPALDYCASSRAMMPALKKISLTFYVSSADIGGWEASLGTLAKSHLPRLHGAGMLEWSAVQSEGVRGRGGWIVRR